MSYEMIRIQYIYMPTRDGTPDSGHAGAGYWLDMAHAHATCG